MKLGLKVSMIVWAAIGILYGLAFLFFPKQVGSTTGYEQWIWALFGIAYIVPSVFVIIAARDPLKNIMWVQLAIAWSILDALVGLYFIIRGYVNFSQAGMGIIIDVVFLVVFLCFYPWRAAKQ